MTGRVQPLRWKGPVSQVPSSSSDSASITSRAQLYPFDDIFPDEGCRRRAAASVSCAAARHDAVSEAAQDLVDRALLAGRQIVGHCHLPPFYVEHHADVMA